MDAALASINWTEDHWSRICNAVTEEARRARIAAQVLPCVSLEDSASVAIPEYRLKPQAEPYPFDTATRRLWVDGEPTLKITTISVNVPLRSHEVADPSLSAALVMFRRAANYVVRIEDTLVFNGRQANAAPPGVSGIISSVYRVTGEGAPPGIFLPGLPGRITPSQKLPPPKTGNDVFERVVAAVSALEAGGASGPFACVLSNDLFQLVVTPTNSLVLPRDRLLPFLQGPVLRSSQITDPYGCVIALGGTPVELVYANDIGVRFLQTSPEPRYIFRVSERVALRIKEPESIAIIE